MFAQIAAESLLKLVNATRTRPIMRYDLLRGGTSLKSIFAVNVEREFMLQYPKILRRPINTVIRFKQPYLPLSILVLSVSIEQESWFAESLKTNFQSVKVIFQSFRSVIQKLCDPLFMTSG